MRIPILLYTYLAAEILAPLLAGFVILNCVLFLARIVPLLDILLDYGISLADFTRLCLYLSPQLFIFSLPMATMLGIIIGLSKLANDNEILALKTAGISPWQMLPPVAAVALAMALVTGYCSTSLSPAGTRAMEKTLFQLAKEKIDHGLQAQRFSENLGDVVLYIDAIDPQTRQWQGVYVTDMRDPDTPATVMARTGDLSADVANMQITLSLNNGSLHRARGDISQEISFRGYTLNLALPQPTGEFARTGSKFGLTQAQLLEQAEQVGPFSRHGIDLRIEYHTRIVLAAGCLILGLLGFPLGLLAGSGRRAPGIPLALLLFMSYYILLLTGQNLSEKQILAVAPAMWLGNILFLALAGYLLSATARETLSRHFERMLAPFQHLAEQLRHWWPALSTKQASQPGLPESTPLAGSAPLRGNVSSMVFHRPGCKFYTARNCSAVFAGPAAASAAGFQPCKLCDPAENIIPEGDRK
ncbi:MAG: LptF/LptG family permease [Desulfobacterales bacterium]|nr:LptF/LptG family permease [Desulfobacterales bacterium]